MCLNPYCENTMQLAQQFQGFSGQFQGFLDQFRENGLRVSVLQ